MNDEPPPPVRPTRTLTARLKEILARPVDGGGDADEGDHVAEALVLAARGGDVRAIQMIFDRVDGRAKLSADEDARPNGGPRIVIPGAPGVGFSAKDELMARLDNLRRAADREERRAAGLPLGDDQGDED